LLGKGFEVGFVATADRPEDRPAIEIEELVDLAEGIGVGAPHEAVADQAHFERFLLAHGKGPSPLTAASRGHRELRPWL
jgi:hypothetical protein